MVDAPDKIPPAVDQSGTMVVWWFPGVTPPKLTDLTSGSAAKRITYSFTPTGWKPEQSQEIRKAGRLTLEQDIETFGKKVKGLTLQYVDSLDAGSAAVLLTEGLDGFFIERRNVDNDVAASAEHKFTVWPVQLGEQIEEQPVGEGEWTIAQVARVTGAVVSRGTLSAT